MQAFSQEFLWNIFCLFFSQTVATRVAQPLNETANDIQQMYDN